MSDRIADGTIGEFMFWLIALAIIVAIACGVASYKCHAQWEGSGMKSDWGLAVGCRVQVPDGRWLPADNVRDIDIRAKDSK